MSDKLREALVAQIKIRSGDWICCCGGCQPPVGSASEVRRNYSCVLAQEALAATEAAPSAPAGEEESTFSCEHCGHKTNDIGELRDVCGDCFRSIFRALTVRTEAQPAAAGKWDAIALLKRAYLNVSAEGWICTWCKDGYNKHGVDCPVKHVLAASQHSAPAPSESAIERAHRWLAEWTNLSEDQQEVPALAAEFDQIRREALEEAALLVDKAFTESWVVQDTLDAIRALAKQPAQKEQG